jgi:hypothetical protein
MKISPVPPAGAPMGAVEGSSPSVRSLRINTNATPGRVEAQVENLPPVAAKAEELPISDPNGEVVEESQPLSPQYAALARQRRALQVKEREIQDRERALETKAADKGDSVLKAQLTSNPLQTLLDAGVTWDQLTQAVVDYQNGPNAELRDLKNQVKSLEEGFEKKLTDRESQQEQQVLQQITREATRLSAEGEDFELVRTNKSVPKVVDLIKRTYDKTGEVMDTHEALQLVEEELLKDVLQKASSKKVQSKIAPAPPPQPVRQNQMRTLTNRDTAQVPMSPKARALAAFHNQLKSS